MLKNKLSLFIGLFGFFLISMASLCRADGGWYRTYAIDYDSTTVKSEIYLDGNFYLVDSTESITGIIDYSTSPTTVCDVAFESGTTYPIKLYNGDLQVVTTGYGITFADGSLQTTAGVGSALNTLSSTGTVVINSDSDNSGDESIYFRTDGATNRMIVKGGGGNVGIDTLSPVYLLDVNGSIGLESSASIEYDTTTYSVSFSTGIVVPTANINGLIELENVASFDYDSSNYEIDISTDININGSIGLENTATIEYNTSKYKIDFSTGIIIDNSPVILDRDGFRTTGGSNLFFNLTGAWYIPGLDGDASVRPVMQYNTSTKEVSYLTSSRRYKENIVDIGNTSWLYNLRPVNFNSKKNIDKIEIGLIAEEVELVNPDLCFYIEKNGKQEIEGVLYNSLIIPMLKEIQKLRQEVDELKNP